MKLTVAVTLAFVVLTSLLSAPKNIAMAPRRSDVAGAVVGFLVTVWCGYLSFWVWKHF